MSNLIKIKVFVEAKKEKVEQNGERILIYVKAKKERGEANREALELLSKFLKIPKNKLIIIKGRQTPNKIIKVYNKDS